ncbi:hypothetical protein GPECTOR_4g989 [Gonium pectorale]|uniref:RING-type domain-containing protein n=1 Tax=Gonium pectorale TaxID=33097 RepID=A0A150GYD7_GONPE|nr:hypothetical protein GPECTOR_4g989 [Gonium pectorale]|eukprot:KXZ54917.1 hypothetical protein GPECTOR_4g989 [Gonium pectorale]
MAGEPSPGPEAPDDGTSVSGGAERHRLLTETAGLSLQAMAEWVADLVPFVLLLMWAFVIRHIGTIMLIVFLAALTFHANADIRRLIALRREASAASCLGQALSVAAFSLFAVAMTLPGSQLLHVLTMRRTEVPSAVDALLMVLLADSLLRFASLAPKLAVVAWFRSEWGAAGGAGGGGSYMSAARQQRQQSRVLTVVERGVALYRSMLPTPVWYGYFIRSFSPVLASLFCGFYLVAKASTVVAQARLLTLALLTATRRSALYGTYVGRDDSGESGSFGACPVCQDPVTTPVRLDCGHIFCEECILEWLERDRTCPMCRAQVRPTGLPTCSDGASPLLPQIF